MDPDPQGRVDFIFGYPTYHESFAYAQQNAYRGRRDYPLSYPRGSGYDRGHGIDLADTIPQTRSSNYTPLNYLPQGIEYNRNLRRILVDDIRKRGGSYGEIAIYTPNPAVLKQSIKRKYSQSGNAEIEYVKIPKGFIFKEIYPNTHPVVYYFPNNAGYAKQGNQTYLDIARLYKIENAHGIIRPYIYDFSLDTGRLRYDLTQRFLMGLNILGIDSFFLPRSTVFPYYWDSIRGFSILDEFADLYPIFPSQTRLKKEDKALLLEFFGKKLLEESGKHEFSTSDIKLALVKLSHTVFKDERMAREWINIINGQIGNFSSAKDVLQVLKVYLETFETVDAALLNFVCPLLTSKVNFAPLEDRLEIEYVREVNAKYNLPISGALDVVRNIGPENSAILRERSANYSAASTLIDLVNQTSNLTEFSIEDLSLWIEPKKLHFKRYGQHFSFSPLREIIFGLETRSPYLKKMNFSGIHLNGEELGDNILEFLNLTRFPSLKYLDLSFTGATGSPIKSNFCSLTNTAPKLKFLNADSNPLSQKAIDDIANIVTWLPSLKVSIQDNLNFVQLPSNITKSAMQRILLTLDMSDTYYEYNDSSYEAEVWNSHTQKGESSDEENEDDSSDDSDSDENGYSSSGSEEY